MNPFIGQIMMFGGNFAPRGWAFCQGQLLPIAQNTALFSILGTIYGGDGRTTFGLPDLQGRLAISPGRGPGLSDYRQGQKGGTQTNSLTINNLPQHNHVVSVPVNTGETGEAAGVLGNGPIYAEEATTGANYPGVSAASTGGGQPVNNMEPYLAVNYIIALQGTFPSRS
jgi:microcystin-dependent protein